MARKLLPVACAATAALAVATLVARPSLARPGEPSPSPTPAQPKDELTKALDVVKAIPVREKDKPDLVVVPKDDKRIEAVKKAALAIAREGEPKGVNRLIDKLWDEKVPNYHADHLVHFALREALVEVPLGSKGETELQKRLKSDRLWQRQVALAWVMRKRPPNAGDDALLQTLAKSTGVKPFVQSACIRALGHRRCVLCVDELIELLAAHENDKDRLWLDAREALHEITGYDRATAKAWRALWQEKGKGFDPERGRGKDPAWRFTLPESTPPEKAKGGPGAPTGPSPAPVAPSPSPTEKPEKYFTPGDKVVVCIDVSWSLHVREVRPGEPRPANDKRKCPECGGDHGPGTGDVPVERSRLNRSKVVCQELLAGLRKKSKFQLIRFATSSHALNVRGLMLEASLQNLENARDFLAPVEANGVTKMGIALDDAFACDDMEVLYLITDGAPTGDVPNTEDAVAVDEIIAVTRCVNRFRGVRIFPICFKQLPAPLLTLMAGEHGGNVVPID